MESKANAAIYKDVPVEAEVHNIDVTSTAVKKAAPSKFVTAFLKCHGPESRVTESLGDDLQYKQYFLDNVAKTEKNKFDRRQGKRKVLPCTERKRLKVFDINPSQQRYSMFIPLHQLWKDYVDDLIPPAKLGAKNKAVVEQQLLRADYHGSIITVTRSRCPGLVGATGIVLQETRNVFRIITKEDRLKTIPKQNTVFTVQHAGYIFTIYGNQFRIRSSDRVSKKFKVKATVDL